MHRAAFLRVAALALLLPAAVVAQTPTKVWRIGFLATVPTSAPDAARNWAAFEQALRERGYAEGRNVVFERRFSEGHPERFPALARAMYAGSAGVFAHLVDELVQRRAMVVAARIALVRDHDVADEGFDLYSDLEGAGGRVEAEFDSGHDGPSRLTRRWRELAICARPNHST